MKTFSDAAIDALESGTAIVSAAVAIYCDPPVFLWGGEGDWTMAGDTGDEIYNGIGSRGALIQQSSGVLGGAAQNVTLQLSGVEPEIIAILDADEVRDAPVVVRRLIFSSSGRELLGAYVFTRGRVDELSTIEMVGGPATVQLSVEGAARGLGRRGSRMRSDADQRLVKTNDGFFRSVSFAAEKTLYWGGKKPARAGSALGGLTLLLQNIFSLPHTSR